jgi:hypothetical protein
MGDGDELDLKRPDAPSFPVGHFDEGEIVGDLRFRETMSRKAQREGRSIDRHVDVFHQVAQGAGVVLVTVGEHDRVHPVAPFDQPAKVRQDDVDAVHGGLGEHESRVHHHDAAVLFYRRAVSSDLA